MQDMHKIRVPRATDDLDFGVAVSDWQSYDQLKRKLIDQYRFSQDAKQEQRLWRENYKIDIVPYGGLESSPGEIAFPPKGDFKMTTEGFPEAFASSLRITLNDSEVRTASLPGITLLKFVAYHDRGREREKDLQDILFIAKNYLDAGADEKLYGRDIDLLDDDAFDYVLSGARILGRDLASIAEDRTRTIVTQELEKLGDCHDASETIGALLRQIQIGFEERRS
jgi:predicted nucleotidyltransferase